MTDRPDPVGVVEICARLDAKLGTVHKWITRDLLPPADYARVNGSRAWEWVTILHWAGATGRLRGDELAAEYRERFGADPAPPKRGGRLAA